MDVARGWCGSCPAGVPTPVTPWANILVAVACRVRFGFPGSLRDSEETAAYVSYLTDTEKVFRGPNGMFVLLSVTYVVDLYES